MTPNNPSSKLAATPIALGVHAHSIILVAGKGPVEGSDDSVVTYSSSHLDGVDSLICRPVHSLDAVEPVHDRGGAADPAAHAAEICARIACGTAALPRTGMQALTLR